MAHLPPGMEFPNGPMTIDMLLIASLVLVFVFVMLIIGASVWTQSRNGPEKPRAVRGARASRPSGVGHAGGDGRAIRQKA